MEVFSYRTALAACLVFLVITAAIASIALLPASALAESRPNILFILADNLGYGELGVYGGDATRGAASISLPSRADSACRS